MSQDLLDIHLSRAKELGIRLDVLLKADSLFEQDWSEYYDIPKDNPIAYGIKSFQIFRKDYIKEAKKSLGVMT